MNDIGPRIGTFFYLMAAGLMVLFLASDLNETPVFDLCFGSLILGAIGWTLRKRAARPESSGRFRIIRAWRDARARAAEKKKNDQKK